MASATTAAIAPAEVKAGTSSVVSSLPCINPATHPLPFSLLQWIEDNRADLKPPVSNKLIHGAGCQFKIMIVGGPNNRTDYHINNGEEWFYQLNGDMVLRVVDNGEFRDIPIREGHAFLLPPNVPHSPQRSAGSIGLVIERERWATEMDGLRWYCREASCRKIVYEEYFKCEDLGSQLKVKIAAYYGSEKLRTCSHCGVIDQPPTAPFTLPPDVIVVRATEGKATGLPAINPVTHPMPYSLMGWIEANRGDLKPPVGNKMIHGFHCQWKVMVVGGPNTRTDYHIDAGEEWFYMIKGDMTLKVVDNGVHRDIVIRQGQSFLLPGNVPHSPQRQADTIGLVVERERLAHEQDGLRWYCSGCGKVLSEHWFTCADLGAQLTALILKYYSEESLPIRTCRHCGVVDVRPTALAVTPAASATTAATATK